MKMFFIKFYRLANLIICWQLTFAAPLAQADQLPVRADGTLSTAAQWTEFGAQFLGGLTSGYAGAMQGQRQNQYGQYRQRLEPILALTPEQPGTYPAVFNGCMVLPSRGNNPALNAMCKNATQDELLGGYADAMMDIADNNMNELINTQRSNDRSEVRGETCYQERIKDLAVQLKAREEALSQYKQNIRNILDGFELRSKSIVEAMKQNDAILNGPCKTCKNRNGVENKDYLRDFRFDNLILGQDDQNKCGSWFTADTVSKDGKAKGLRGIEQTVTAKIQPARDFQAKEKQIRKEIKQLSRELSKRYKKRNGYNIQGNAVASNNQFIKPGSAAFDQAVNNFNTRISNQIEDIASEMDIANVIGSNDMAMGTVERIRSGNMTPKMLGNALTQYERNEKRTCMMGLISQFGSPQELMGRFRNPNVSKGKNRDADNFLANTIISHIGNLGNMDLDEFMERVRAEEGKGMNSRKVMTTGKTFTVDNRTINASTPLRASDLFGIFSQNCKDQFDTLDTDSGFSRREIIANVKSFASKLDRIKKTGSQTLRQSIEKDLLTCPSNTTTGNGASTCSEAAFDPADKAGNFCVAAAQRCSANVNACQQRVQSKVTELNSQQDQLTQDYKAEVANTTGLMMAEVNAVKQFMASEASRLDGLLGVGTLTALPQLHELPGDAGKLISEQNLLREDMPAELALEDPIKFLKLAEAQIDQVEETMKEQRIALVGNAGDGATASDPMAGLQGKGILGKYGAGYLESYQSAMQEYQDIIADCEGAVRGAEEAERQRLQGIQEMNAEIADACDAVEAFNANPMSGDPANIASDAAAAVRLAASMPSQDGRTVNARRDMAQIDRIRAFNAECAENAGGLMGQGLSVGGLCDVMANNDDSGLNEYQKRVYEHYSSARSNIQRYCRDSGNSSGGDNLEICRSNDPVLETQYKICKISGTGNIPARVKISDSQAETGSSLRDSGIILANCPSSVIDASTNETVATLGWETVTPSRNAVNASLSDFPAPSGALLCDPSSQSGGNRRVASNAKKELEAVIAGFNCAEEKRKTGEIGLSTCGANTNGFLTEKGSWGDAFQQLANPLGQALAN